MSRTIALIGCLLLLLAGISGMCHHDSDMSEMEKHTPILSKLYFVGYAIPAVVGLAELIWILIGGELP